MTSSRFVLICSALCIAASALAQPPLSVELVVNGGAETGDTSGWQSAGIDAVPALAAAAGFGQFVFTGGTGSAVQTMSQEIDVAAHAAAIDAGEIEATAAAYLQSRQASGLTDRAYLGVSYRDIGGVEIAGIVLVDDINLTLFDWNFYADCRVVPAGTRSILLTVISDRSDGQSSDGFIDEVTLTLGGLDSDTDCDGQREDTDNCLLIANPDQRDSNGDGFGNACDPDLNDDGIVNAADLGLFKAVFFSDNADADFDGDGVVNSADLGVMKLFFFMPPGPSAVAR